MRRLVVFALVFAPIAAASATENIPPATRSHAFPVDDNPLYSIPLSALSETRDRPLFSATRRPLPANTPVVAVSKAPIEDKGVGPEHPPFVLKGTILGSDVRVAVLLDPATNRTKQLQLGKTDSGWTVSSVNSRSIVLRKGELLSTLELPRPAVTSTAPVINGGMR